MASNEHLPAGVVVVTGAGRGIGRGLVTHLRQRGRPVIAVVRRRATDEEAAVAETPGSPGRGGMEGGDGTDGVSGTRDLHGVEADLASAEGIEAALAGIDQALADRPLAAVVNGAGAITPIAPLLDHDTAALMTALTLMAVAPARLAGALAPRLVPGGRILNLSTRSAHATFPGLSLYCMSKHALHSLSRSLQLELDASIGVAALIPGEVDTGMQADLRAPDPAAFPLASFFRDNQPNLIPVEVAVAFITWVLTGTPLATYRREEPWFIYDRTLQPLWLPEGMRFDYPEP